MTIYSNFKNLKDFKDISDLLEIPVEFLWKIVIKNKNNNYKKFKLRKKRGERTIYSPSKNLAILQKKLAYILNLIFTSHNKSHGFVKNRGIVTNASAHINKKFVLNFDLENFFESISFRRVRHMFKAYFKLNTTVATTLANICCHPKGFLPQGASTSPIISNILAKSLDRELTQLAQSTRWCHYTRYADDITISTNRKEFPKDIAHIDNHNKVILNKKVIDIVERYGFKINDNKTRLHNFAQSQMVTGIVVNEKLNIKRAFIRRIRSILHCIEKNIDNMDEAVKIFESKYPFRQKKGSNLPDMFNVLRGMISHVGNVKGKTDSVYLKLGKRFNAIAATASVKAIRLPLTKIDFHEKCTFIIDNPDVEFYLEENGDLGEYIYGQGTGFLLKGIGLVTNAHVISEAIDVLDFGLRFTREYNIAFYSSKDYHIKKWAKILCYDTEKDIAILSVRDLDISSIGYSYIEKTERDQRIELIGFPDYRIGQEIKVQEGILQGRRMHNFVHKRYEITTTIYGGNSGGPVVNEYNEVIGVAVKGASLKGVSPNEIIPISDVIELAREKGILDVEQNLIES